MCQGAVYHVALSELSLSLGYAGHTGQWDRTAKDEQIIFWASTNSLIIIKCLIFL